MTLPNLVHWILFWMDLRGLSNNKKLLKKEKGYRNAENASDNESNNNESWKSGGADGGGN